jgi:hypothetical protein
LLRCEWLQRRVEELAIVEMMLVMVGERIAILLNHVARWVDLHHHTAAVFLPHGEETRAVGVDAIVSQVSVGKEASMAARTIGKIPSMDLNSLI